MFRPKIGKSLGGNVPPTSGFSGSGKSPRFGHLIVSPSRATSRLSAGIKGDMNVSPLCVGLAAEVTFVPLSKVWIELA